MKKVNATGRAVGLAEWIIDDTCLVMDASAHFINAENDLC